MKYILIIYLFFSNSIRATEWAPVTYVINGTFDVAQNKNWFNQNDLYYFNRSLWYDVRDPNHAIKRDGGYKKFIEDEFLSRRVVPNILLHTIGGSYDGHWFYDYFKERNAKFPLIYMSLTYYLARWGNEVIEVSHESLNSHDHISDLFFFDPLGIVLSQNPWWSSFLTKDLNMRAWHSLPYYQIADREVVNAGLNYIIRPPSLKLAGSVSPFFYFGMQNILGLSFELPGSVISAGAGLFYTDPLNDKSKLVGAFFYEENDNLALSLFLNGSEQMKWRVNVYPQMNNFMEKYSIGILVGESRGQEPNRGFFGISAELPIGILALD